MGSQISPGAIAALRAVSFRIGSTAPAQLPHVVAGVVPSLRSCKDLFSKADSLRQKDGEAGLVLHRFNTQILTLLQSRTTEERWAAVVLVKATIEVGGWEVLSKANAWVQALLSILKRPDPPTTKCFCVSTLTRIFMLTWDYPTLIRETTTPALPTYISTCINIVDSQSYGETFLQAVLESFATLVPRHPTVFRNHQNEIKRILAPLIEVSKPSTIGALDVLPEALRKAAAHLHVLLHQCEPRQGASAKWEHQISEIVTNTHLAADRLLVGVDEDWQSITGILRNKSHLSRATNTNATESLYTEAANVKEGIRLITSHFTTHLSATVTTSFGPLLDLVSRLFATASSLDLARSHLRFRADTSRDEKDVLVSLLPAIHISAIRMLLVLLDRFGAAGLPFSQTILDQIAWIFRAEHADIDLRTMIYAALKKAITLSGGAMVKSSIDQLGSVIKSCCNDLLPVQKSKSTITTNGQVIQGTQTGTNADSFLKQANDSDAQDTTPLGLKKAANELLPILLSRLPASQISGALRVQMDRTAVLIRHKDALIASVLNPPPKQASGSRGSSLLPLLAREYASDSAVESLLRPRMPVLHTGQLSSDQTLDNNHDEQMDYESTPEAAESAPESTEQLEISDVGETVSAQPSIVERAYEEYTAKHGGTRAEAVAPLVPQTATAMAMNPGQERKRQHETQQSELDSKRQRPSPVPATVSTSSKSDDAEQSKASLPIGASAQARQSAGLTQGVEDDSDDDDFVVPTLDLHDSSDDEEEDEEKQEE